MMSGGDRYEQDLTAELLETVRTGNLRGATALLIAGANVNGSPQAGTRPLLLATETGNVRLMHTLIETGADVDAGAFKKRRRKGGGGWEGGGVDRDREDGDATVEGTRALHIAARRGSKAALRLLLCAGADPSAADRDGLTPLMAACGSPRNGVAVGRELLRAGADPRAADRRGSTAVHHAAREGRGDLVDLLVAKVPATLNRLNSDGRTPLCVAAESGRGAAALHRLLLLGARQPPAASPPGAPVKIRCPLLAAVRKNRCEAAQALVARGMEWDVGGGSLTMRRALQTAAETGKAKMLHVLLTGREGGAFGCGAFGGSSGRESSGFSSGGSSGEGDDRHRWRSNGSGGKLRRRRSASAPPPLSSDSTP